MTYNFWITNANDINAICFTTDWLWNSKVTELLYFLFLVLKKNMSELSATKSLFNILKVLMNLLVKTE